MKSVRRIGTVGIILLTLLALLGAILLCADDAATYAERSRAALTGMGEEEKTRWIGMDAPTQETCARVIRDYLTRGAPDMDFFLPDGTRAFSAKELSHMRDVRGLLRMAKAAALALTAVLALLVVRYERLRRRIGQSDAARALLEGEWIGLGALGALIAALFIWAAVDFYSLFASFHRLVFTNENWLLDPQTDRLIRMMPQRLFETLCLRVAAQTVLAPLLAVGFTAGSVRRQGGRGLKQRKEKET
jgi:integral membrane protein (TIGR01906 family)